MTRILTLAAVLAATASVSADVTVTVTGGTVDLINVPITASLPDVIGNGLYDLKPTAGAAVLAQTTGPGLLATGKARELHFVLPHLKAGETLTFVASPTKMPPDARWVEEKGQFLEYQLRGKPVLRYMNAPFDASTKPTLDKPSMKVWHHLFDPTGKVRLTNGPEGRYAHHRGLYFGFNRISYGDNLTADTWHGRNGEHQTHDGVLASEAGPVLGRHRLKIGWHGKDAAEFASETREMTVYPLPTGQLVEFATVLTTALPKVRLDGDPQHAGFHFRANSEVENASQETYFLRTDGKGEPGQERNWEPKSKKGPVNLPWNAMSFVLGGERYTAVYLDKPTNPKEARGSERAYGRIGSYFEYDLTPDHPLKLNYRVWVQPGEMTVAQCEALSAAFVNPPKVVVTTK